MIRCANCFQEVKATWMKHKKRNDISREFKFQLGFLSVSYRQTNPVDFIVFFHKIENRFNK